MPTDVQGRPIIIKAICARNPQSAKKEKKRGEEWEYLPEAMGTSFYIRCYWSVATMQIRYGSKQKDPNLAYQLCVEHAAK